MDPRMKRKTRASLLIVVLAMNLVLLGSPDIRAAHACSCVGTPLDERLGELDAVFAGEVTDIEEDDLAPGVGPPLGRVVFEVSKTWKGPSEGPVVVYGQGDEVSCGLDFDRNKSYLVFAYRTDDGPGDHLETSYCEATKPLAEAGDDLRLLGSPPDTLPDTGGPVVSLLDWEAMGVAAMLLALLTLGGVLVVRWGHRA